MRNCGPNNGICLPNYFIFFFWAHKLPFLAPLRLGVHVHVQGCHVQLHRSCTTQLQGRFHIHCSVNSSSCSCAGKWSSASPSHNPPCGGGRGSTMFAFGRWKSKLKLMRALPPASHNDTKMAELGSTSRPNTGLSSPASESSP